MSNFLKALKVKGIEIDTAGATTGDVLKYDGTKFGAASVSAGSLALDNLTDVVITSPTNYQLLTYDGTNWVNSEPTVTTYVRNGEATTLNIGEVVYLSGQQGDRAEVKRAINTGDSTSAKTLGIVGASIASAADGPVVTQGYAYGLNLGSYTVGQTLYLGSTAGTMTATKPHAPNHLVYVGVVVRANNGNGILYVRAQNGYELDEIHDVDLVTTPPSSGDFLKYNGTLWVNDPINLGTDTVGNYMSDISGTSPVSVSHTPAEGSSATVALSSGYGDTQNPYASKTANYVLASPDGTAGTPSFRALTTTDIPYPGSANQIIYKNGSNAATGSSGLTYNGTDFSVGGKISSTASAGDEGGELFLAQPQTNNTLSGGVTIDLYQNKIRFFEQGGSARGYYIDITGGGAGVGTNLVSGGGGATTLDGLNDVTAPSPTSGDFLKWNGTAWVNDAIDLGTDTTGNYVGTITAGTGVSTTGASTGEGVAHTISIGQDVATSASPSFAGLTVDTNTLYVDASNNRVGIGTTSPGATLDVQSSSINPTIRATNSGAGNALTVVGNAGISQTLTVTQDFYVDTNVFAVDTTNNRVGVNTNTPQATLDVQATSGVAMRVTNTGVGDSFRIEDTTSDTTPFVIDASGNVGIGTIGPQATLDVQASTGTAMRITNTGTGNSLLVEDATSTDTSPFVIDASGNVGIGTTSVTLAKAEVVGSIRAYPAATQDAVVIAGRAGGTSSYAATITPTTLTASQTLTLPNNTGELLSFTSARGTNTAWTTYTTTITQLGTVTFTTGLSRYTQMGRTIHWEFVLNVTGSGTVSNAIRINIPQTAQANAQYSTFGTMHIYDASANTHYCGNAFAYSTTQASMMLNAGTTYFQTIALASGDIITGHIIYEAA